MSSCMELDRCQISHVHHVLLSQPAIPGGRPKAEGNGWGRWSARRRRVGTWASPSAVVGCTCLGATAMLWVRSASAAAVPPLPLLLPVSELQSRIP